MNRIFSTPLDPSRKFPSLEGRPVLSSSKEVQGRVNTRRTSEASNEAYSMGQEGITSSISCMRRMVSLRATTISAPTSRLTAATAADSRPQTQPMVVARSGGPKP